MKHFWKTTNRGLLLGALLLVVLFGIIVGNEILFRAENPQIRQTVEDYMTDLFALNVAPDGVELGDTLNAEQKKAKEKQLEDLFVRYWDADKSTADGYASLAYVRDCYQDQLAYPLHTVFKNTEVSITDRDIKIKANGPNYALVTLNFQTASANFIGDGSAIFLGNALYEEHKMTKEEILEAYSKNDIYAATYRVSIDFELHRTSDGWKIISSSGYASIHEKVLMGTGGAN